MANNWDDILAEPIASLADPKAFALSDRDGVDETPGAWLAVSELSDISPRPQEAPMTMPAMDAMLQIRMPIQAETQEPSARLPASLADQLSLTWAARRRHVPEADPEPEPVAAPRPATRRAEAPAPAEPRKPVATWRKPFEAVARVFRQPQPEVATALAQASSSVETQVAPAAPQTRARTAPVAPEPRTVFAVAEPEATAETPAPRAALPDVPLTLATPQRHTDTPEPTQATPAPRGQTTEPSQPVSTSTSMRLDVPLSETPTVRAARLQAPATPVTPARPVIAAEAPAPSSNAASVEPPAPAAAPSLAPRRGLLSWLLPRRASETPSPVTQTPPVTRTTRPAVQPAVSAQTPAPAVSAQSRPQPVDAPQVTTEPTLVQALPALRQALPSTQQDEASEPGLTPEALQGLSPQVALTHLLRNTPAGASEQADAETVHQTLTRMADTGIITEPARVATSEDQGETLPAVLQQRMEGLLDVPLHEVRIFRGQVSQRLAERMQADAVTIGNQVHVAAGEGNPAIPSGRSLLAHEVTHYAVHRVESEGPAATLSSSSSGTGEPTWPQFTGIAPEPGMPSHEAEEALALRVEHVMSRTDAFEAPSAFPGIPAPGAPALPLQHRAQPAQIVVAPGGIPGQSFGAPGGFGAGAFGNFGGFSPGAMGGGGSFGGGGMSNGGGVGMAPWDRIAGDAGDFIDGASNMAGQAQEMAQEVQEQAEDFEDNDEMIEKVAEAVIKHMENKDKFERERRGAFDGTIGG